LRNLESTTAASEEAMKVYWRETDPDTASIQSSMHSTDLDNVFGIEEGCFCNFTNSIVVIYL
jgi:hypothetical protein